jgi:hypothetical protein
LRAEHDGHEIYGSSDFKVLSTRWTCLMTTASSAEECFKNVAETTATTEGI